ncbi:unnamed protein product, partial [Symbiodinium sp. KB8]
MTNAFCNQALACSCQAECMSGSYPNLLLTHLDFEHLSGQSSGHLTGSKRTDHAAAAHLVWPSLRDALWVARRPYLHCSNVAVAWHSDGTVAHSLTFEGILKCGSGRRSPWVTEVFLKDDGQRSGRMWGFITMADAGLAQAAIAEMNGKTLHPPQVDFNAAQQDVPTMHGMHAGGFDPSLAPEAEHQAPAIAGVAPAGLAMNGNNLGHVQSHMAGGFVQE